jgi:hypothetical protein
VTVMQWNAALNEIPSAHSNGALAMRISALQTQGMALDGAILDRAAEALFESCFRRAIVLMGNIAGTTAMRIPRTGFETRPLL